MKKFVFKVAGFEFTDTEAFGTAWQEAKAKATEIHAPVYRTKVWDGGVKTEVYAIGGCFVREDLITEDRIEKF